MRNGQPVTEDHVSGRSDLDLRSTLDLVELINEEDAGVPAAVRSAARPLAAAIDAIAERFESGGRLIYVGAGSSGRLAAVDAAECGPTFGVPPEQMVVLVAGGVAALAVAQEAAEDDEVAGARDVEAANVQERDAVVLLSASGGTPYVVGAAHAARRTGALTVALVCAGDSELGRLAEHEVAVVVGPEVIAGSTRMKAGTAQKLLLNTISTVTMVRLGKTYGNLMVDVVASNAKLRNRARSAVVIATGAPEAEVDAALESSAGDVKVAIVSLLTGVDAADARSRLDAAGGVVRRALVQDVGAMRLGVEAAIVDGELLRGDIEVADGRIVAVGLAPKRGGGIAAPGFVDLQVNGYAGVDFAAADAAGYAAAGEALLEGGVTAYQPTLITAPEDSLLAALREVPVGEQAGPRILGVHLEGPFLSPARLGAHPPAARRDPDRELLERLLAAGPVSHMTLAPELPGALELVDLLQARGIVVSCGHTDATAAEAHAAFDRGVGTVTHLFNAMRPLGHRDPGIVGAALVRDDVIVQVILDGHHLAGEIAQLVWRTAAGRVALVTDAIAAAGTDATTTRLSGIDVEIRDGIARRADGVLAGSVVTMIESVRNLHALGASLVDAIAAATAAPARAARRPGLGVLEPGGEADIVVLDDRLEIRAVLRAGLERVAA